MHNPLSHPCSYCEEIGATPDCDGCAYSYQQTGKRVLHRYKLTKRIHIVLVGTELTMGYSRWYIHVDGIQQPKMFRTYGKAMKKALELREQLEV